MPVPSEMLSIFSVMLLAVFAGEESKTNAIVNSLIKRGLQ
jgi:hypothetical protein